MVAASGRRHFVALALSGAGTAPWVDDYAELLTALRGRAVIWTLDQVARHLVLTSAE